MYRGMPLTSIAELEMLRNQGQTERSLDRFISIFAVNMWMSQERGTLNFYFTLELYTVSSIVVF